MKRKQYNIASDFKKWSKLNPRVSKTTAPFSQFLLNCCFKMEKSNKDCYVKHEVVTLNNRKIKYLIYTPKDLPNNAPCLIYYHGGGFLFPAAPFHYRNARRYATDVKCKVLFPDYPLTPKNPFPIAAEICYEFYKFVMQNAKLFDIDKNKIAVGGDSAGASLSSITCMMASDNKVKVPLAQMLIYPVVGIEPPTPSMVEFSDTGMCNNQDFEKYSKLYFKSESDKQNRYASSLNQEDLSKYPSTYIETAEFDCLRDEGIIFAEKLNQAKVKVSTHFTQGTIHGYDIVKDSPIVEESLKKRIEFLKNQFK